MQLIVLNPYFPAAYLLLIVYIAYIYVNMCIAIYRIQKQFHIIEPTEYNFNWYKVKSAKLCHIELGY